MNQPSSNQPSFLPITLTFIGLAIVVTGLLAWRLISMLPESHETVGDGETVESYGFDLSNLTVDRAKLYAAGIPKDYIKALVDPPTMTVDDVTALNEAKRGKYLVSGDRVIGVTINGEARAYPLRILNYHEIVNDTVGGEPIAVTYHPICDSAVVFERTIGDEVLEFGVSGLLYNSNLVMYDRQEKASDERLWCQLLGRAITGKATQTTQTLKIVHFSLISWAEWKKQHPQTKVLKPDPQREAQYKKTSYQSYFGSDILRFPAEPLPELENGLKYKTPVVVVLVGNERRVYTYQAIQSRLNNDNLWHDEIGGNSVTFMYYDDPETVTVQSNQDKQHVDVLYCFWFAWYALYPESELVR